MAKEILKKIFEAPAVALEKGLDKLAKFKEEIINKEPFKAAEEYWNTLGPGLTTGAADDDPSGIATYSQTGAQFGPQLLWLAIFTFPLMAIVQEICARIGLVTGEGLAGSIKSHYGKSMLYISILLLFIANTFNMGADLGAMAKASQLIMPNANFIILILFFTFVSLFLQIFTTYARYAKYLKYLTLMLLSYVFSVFVVHIEWHSIWRFSLIPSLRFTKDEFFIICAILGTTISPYLFFWQTSQEVEEDISRGKFTIQERRGTTAGEIKRMRTDVWSGMFLSNLVMFFIILVCAATLYVHGITNIDTAEQAALALKPLAGGLAFLLFTLGIIGTGMLAIPVLAGSTAYAMSESFDWGGGLYLKLHQAYAFYGVIIVSMLVAMVMNFLHLNPIKVLIYSAFANGLIAPVVIALILGISTNKTTMGEHANSNLTSTLGWITAGLMGISGVAAIITLFS